MIYKIQLINKYVGNRFPKVKKYIGKCIALNVALTVFIIASAISWGVEVNFLSEYSFTLLSSSGLVKREFEPVLAASLVEVVCFAVVMSLLCAKLLKLQRLHATVDDTAVRKRRLIVCSALIAITLGAMRYVSLLLRYFAKNTNVTLESNGMITSGVVTEPLLPWFSAVVIAVTVAFVFYSYYLFTSIKEDVEINYS